MDSKIDYKSDISIDNLSDFMKQGLVPLDNGTNRVVHICHCNICDTKITFEDPSKPQVICKDCKEVFKEIKDSRNKWTLK